MGGGAVGVEDEAITAVQTPPGEVIAGVCRGDNGGCGSGSVLFPDRHDRAAGPGVDGQQVLDVEAPRRGKLHHRLTVAHKGHGGSAVRGESQQGNADVVGRKARVPHSGPGQTVELHHRRLKVVPSVRIGHAGGTIRRDGQ